ncbi:Patched domain-containing protein 3 [Liparis tanakae]|uniref:Patched domain-containing protein 3 n=1 Tax=Liparis tanakae TaxID=230148 RepID=A0A4Z2ITY0_9TELE|nr:Patched domain-containing protein 3 [Liparis tanakae]
MIPDDYSSYIFQSKEEERTKQEVGSFESLCVLKRDWMTGYGTVASTRPATARLLVPQADPLTLAFTLPKPWGLEDLLHELLKGALDAIFGLGSGFYLLEDRTSNDIEEQFTPLDGQAKLERKYIQETFPRNDSMFSRLRLSTDGNYATLIATSDRNILTVDSLQHILDLDFRVRSMVVYFDNRSDNVRTKVWVASCGVLSTGLAVLSGFGALLLLDQPFVMTVASCPFMILGIGLDDMFIMISCWQRTRVLDSVPDRLADAYRDAAVSISITTLTDALALFLGYGSPFGSVRSFCLYSGVSICFCYLYSVTFLGACLALNGQREAENKHWFTCAKIPEDVPCRGSKAFSVCCVGGNYDREGLDIGNLALDDSYIVEYYNNQRQHFSEYSYTVMVAVKQPLRYWDEDEQKLLRSCISRFESLNYTLSNTTTKDLMTGLRKAAEESPVELLVYHPAFIYFDQYTVVMDNTIQTILVAVIVMLVVSLLLIPSPLCSLWVAFAMCSVLVGVTGFMALWGVNLDCISMINLVMCIGFSVDFSAHISYSFVSSPKIDANEKAIDALAHLGYPILQGALSTILGVVVLSMSGSYIFRTFFKIVFLVITFGVLHGLVFIPVFLTLVGSRGAWR